MAELKVIIEPISPEIKTTVEPNNSEIEATVRPTAPSVDVVINPVGLPGKPGQDGRDGVDGDIASSDFVVGLINDHTNDPTPHPAYDDGPSLALLYMNAKV